jgi:hypothetical protein
MWFSIILNNSGGWGILPVSSLDHTGISANKWNNSKLLFLEVIQFNYDSIMDRRIALPFHILEILDSNLDTSYPHTFICGFKLVHNQFLPRPFQITIH